MPVSLTSAQEQLRMEVRKFAQEKIRPAVAEREWLPDPRQRIDWDFIEQVSAPRLAYDGSPG